MMKTVKADKPHRYCQKDEDDRPCVKCHMLSLDRKFILHKGTVHVINKHITSCKQQHNMYIIRCLLCDTWDQHRELTPPHALISNLRVCGYSLSPEEHPHPRRTSEVMIFPVWSYHTATIKCTECHLSTPLAHSQRITPPHLDLLRRPGNLPFPSRRMRWIQWRHPQPQPPSALQLEQCRLHLNSQRTWT